MRPSERACVLVCVRAGACVPTYEQVRRKEKAERPKKDGGQRKRHEYAMSMRVSASPCTRKLGMNRKERRENVINCASDFGTPTIDS